ncbi:MAG TPA: 6-hydroxymethylpterin diphosphokinase MptE-like protein, partial [Waddliaceae bacterium]
DQKNRFIVFFEDDLAVLRMFLSLEKACEVLSDPQVVIQAITIPSSLHFDFVPHDFFEISWMFAHTPYQFALLRVYEKRRMTLCTQIQSHLYTKIKEREFELKQYQDEYQKRCCRNVYMNVFCLPYSFNGHELEGKFQGTPAIICGAGPSLENQISLLRSIQDKALIFGAGTAMNVLTRHGLSPHFGGGVDPSTTSRSRLTTSFAFEVPYFYQNRFNYEALELVHGYKLFVSGTDFYNLRYLEEKLGILSVHPIFAELSTTSFCLAVAEALGCNPIILVGVDLAYKDYHRYPKGVTAHPLDTKLEHKEVYTIFDEEIIPGKNVDGNELPTRLDWVLEANSYSRFSYAHPRLNLINCTEGGLVIPGVPYGNFSETIHAELTRSFDILNWIHLEIQTSQKFAYLTTENISKALNQWKNSFYYSEKIVDKIFQVLRNRRDKFSSPSYEAEVLSLKEELRQQEAYRGYLVVFEGVFDRLILQEIYALKYHPEVLPPSCQMKKAYEIEFGHLLFLKKTIELQVNLISQAINNLRTLSNKEVTNTEVIHQDSLFDCPYEEQTLKYPNGNIKRKWFYRDGQLHGPSIFYAENGQLLAEGWFSEGFREGENKQYYLSGKLYSLQNFHKGTLNGKQRYFYENGKLKSLLEYSEGQLDGEVKLFYEDDLPKLEMFFEKGRLSGRERWWSEQGQLTAEVEYENGRPVGIARSWDLRGQLRKEIKYHQDREKCDIFIWDGSGSLLCKEISISDEIGETIRKSSQELAENLANLKNKLLRKKDER